MKFVGEIDMHRTYKCVACGQELRGDHGYMTQEGAHCMNRPACNQRVSRNALEALAAQGIKPRWRR